MQVWEVVMSGLSSDEGKLLAKLIDGVVWVGAGISGGIDWARTEAAFCRTWTGGVSNGYGEQVTMVRQKGGYKTC